MAKLLVRLLTHRVVLVWYLKLSDDGYITGMSSIELVMEKSFPDDIAGGNQTNCDNHQ